MGFLKTATLCLGLGVLVASAYIVKEGDTLWAFDIKLNKTDYYFEDEKSYVELLKAKGPAPASSLDTMEDYESSLAEEELELPDIEDINQEMKDLEDSML